MAIIVVGAGKLAQELLRELPRTGSDPVMAWADAPGPQRDSVVVHAGSGRELEAVMTYCQATASTLVELGTGSTLGAQENRFPLLVCPNTNLLMLRFMAMLAAGGQHFKDCRISIVESHQAGKTSVAGTAVAMAGSLGVPAEQVISIRDPDEQERALKIAPEHLARHAYHRIEIQDQHGHIVLETRVLGSAPYAQGLARIIGAIRSRPLENRRYDILELVANGWV